MKTNILKKPIQLILILCLFLVSCSQNKNYDKAEVEYIGVEETGETSPFSAYQESGASKRNEEKKSPTYHQIKIIRNADCRIEVSHVQSTMQKIRKIIHSYKGYVADERFTNTAYVKENRFIIRIPQTHFDSVLDSICSLAKFVDHKNISTLDVTEEYVDISSRLETKLEVKNRYETILRSKARTVEDLLMTETKLKEIQEEIESAQGRLTYLANKVAFSTIQLDVYQKVIPEEKSDSSEPAFRDKVKRGVSFGWSMVEFLILLLFYVWPLVCIGLFVFGYFKWIRK